MHSQLGRDDLIDGAVGVNAVSLSLAESPNDSVEYGERVQASCGRPGNDRHEGIIARAVF
jgi:hypothetical protein